MGSDLRGREILTTLKKLAIASSNTVSSRVQDDDSSFPSMSEFHIDPVPNLSLNAVYGESIFIWRP